MASDTTVYEKLVQQSEWYGYRAKHNRRLFVLLKGMQIVFAAAIPVVSVAGPANVQRWATATLGALVGIFEGFIQLGQYQQNWLVFRATREALKREEFLFSAKAGPYSGIPDPDVLYVNRCDAIISGENTKWLSSQESGSKR
jgi:hypothetical protein